jgi:manganese/iron transport system substrate-binding protein
MRSIGVIGDAAQPGATRKASFMASAIGPTASAGRLQVMLVEALGTRSRRWVTAGLIAVAVAAMAGLASTQSALAQATAARAKPFRVVTTFTVIQDIAQNVAGTAAVVESITKPGAEIHDYQPTPLDIVKAQAADLVVWNGMNLERWFEMFFQNVKDVPGIVASEGVEPIGIAEGPYTGKPNPHAWMSPNNALIYVENIRKALVKHDPANAETYNKNAAAYAAKIKATDEPLRKRLAAIPEAQRWLVSSEGAFSYLARDYTMRELYLWPINADEVGTPKQIRRVIDLVRKQQIPVVFSESTVSDKPARQVAKETGAKYGGVLYVDSLSDERGPVPSYLKLLEVTVETIVRGFGE